MKYTENNKPLQCFMRQSTWFKEAGNTTIKGILWHSTGANNPNIKRYVQPDDNAANKSELIKIIGTNSAQNDWNHIKKDAGVHAFIGKLADGTVSSVQVGPWSKRAWGCGSGRYGSCNDGWIQFEICEDALSNKDYFDKVYKEGIELTAYLCKICGLDPEGKVFYNGSMIPVILCHQDSYKLGFGSNHSDVYHWFNKYGKTMGDVRRDVAALLKQSEEEEEEEMTQEDFNKMFKVAMDEYRKSLQDNDSGAWSAKSRDWATKTGLVKGGDLLPDGSPNYMWEDFLTREQMATLLYRFKDME